MPNYCYNYIEIVASDQIRLDEILNDICIKKTDSEDLLAYAKETYPSSYEESQYLPSFQKLLPVKEGESQLDTWGTKRDMIEPSLYINSNMHASVSFDTAWNPPQLWFEALCDKYEDVTIVMNSTEGGMGFEVNQGHLCDGSFFYQESEYKESCEECGTRKTSEYREEEERYLCDKCFKS